MDLFEDLPAQRAQGAATGRRAGGTTGAQLSGHRILDPDQSQLEPSSFDDLPEPSGAHAVIDATSGSAADGTSADAAGEAVGFGGARSASIASGNSWDDDDGGHANEAARQPPAAAQPTPPQLAAVLPAKATNGGVRGRTRTLFDEDDKGSSQPMAGKAFQGLSRRKQAQMQRAAGGSQQQANKYAVEKELVLDELQEITDAGKEDITLQVAEAPKVHKSKHVQSLEELEDVGFGRLKHFMQGGASNEGIDLSALTGCLLPEHLVTEGDTFWDKALLLTEVASELQQEREARDALLDPKGVAV